MKKYFFFQRDENIFLILVLFLIFFVFIYFSNDVSGGSGGNVTVITRLDVGRSYPEVSNVTINNGSGSVYLTPNSTQVVYCSAIITDYDEDSDINQTWGVLFNTTLESGDDNNNHYSNSSCNFTIGYGDQYQALANCSFNVYYYANPGNWNCTIIANDTLNWNGTGTKQFIIQELLAVALPDEINYGTVNATSVSNENITNVSNAGNVKINITLDGYARTRGDNQAMNCSRGAIKNISIMYEKYNLTDPTVGPLTLSEFENNYINLTSTPTTKRFMLNSRQDDNNDDAINATYWRIYVPFGVAGTCQGNIVFGATKAAGT